MTPRAAALIERLRLQPHPEGGWFAEVFRSAGEVDPRDGRARRSALTSIYFLLEGGGASAWHRVRSDETWCHLEGARVLLHRLDPHTRSLSSVQLGPVDTEVEPQATVPAGHWQAARAQGEHALLACLVAPASISRTSRCSATATRWRRGWPNTIRNSRP